MEQSQGFIAKCYEEKVLRLKKALYELLSKPALYIKSQGNNTLIVFLYVDDLIYKGNSEKMIQDFKDVMMKTIEMSDLGLMHFFLEIEINQKKDGIFICQKKYTETPLKKCKMEGCKTDTTPLVTGQKYKKEHGSRRLMAPSIEVPLEAYYI
ncbi:UNVERIFIED_CONTAM: hypothetical protein Scaly_0568800 [Sesamum calycinum]|uniref:Reverse transcriptase Ty1/copia-type domain-containing protein n=1 Tax=Sesamum calycinum TaxID=2727403 RepID=A0AAW2RRI4_9LAMI